MKSKKDNIVKTRIVAHRPPLYWFLVLILYSVYSLQKWHSGTVFDTNILSLIPSHLISTLNEKTQLLIQRQLQQETEQKFILLIQDKGKQTKKAVKRLKSALLNSGFLSLEQQGQHLDQKIRSYYHPYRYQLLSAEQRTFLKTHNPEEIAQHQLLQLYSPARDYTLYDFKDDPFNLGGKWLESLFDNLQYSNNGELIHLSKDNSHWYVLPGNLGKSPFDLHTQKKLNNLLSDFKVNHPSEEILTSGMVFHAAEGAKIAQKEILTVGLGSLLVIALLILTIFRSTREIGFILVTLSASALFALSACFFIFDKVHLITIAFGSTLLGIAIDYTFHYLVKRRSLGDAKKTNQALSKGLLISAATSISAYLIQLISPLPGLQQFAIFIASGLFAACITVLIFGPYFFNHQTQANTISKLYSKHIEKQYQRLASLPGSRLLLVTLMILLSTQILSQRAGNDDIRLLNTSGESLLSSEQKIMRILNTFSTQRYFLIEGNSKQQALQRLETLTTKVEALTGKRASELLVSPVSYMPSIKQQKLDYQLIQEKIYSQKTGAATLLCERLNTNCNWLSAPQNFEPLDYSNEAPKILEQLHPTINLLEQGVVLAFIRNQESFNDHWADQIAIPGVQYVDQVKNISLTLKTFRLQVTQLLIGFFILLVLASILFFKKKSLTLIGSITISCLSALYFSTPQGVSLFHVLALLLVIGISIDTAIFYITPGLDNDTWTASSLSCITSLAAFGLLSFSQVPILHQFGQVVFWGLLTAWVTTPIIHHIFHKGITQ